MSVRKNGEIPVSPASVTPEVGIDLLNRLVDDGDRLLNNPPITDVAKSLWENKARDYFARAFGSDPRNINVVLNAGRRSFDIDEDDAYYDRLRFEELKDKIHAVTSMIDLLRLEIDLNTNCPTCGQMYPKGKHNFCLHCGAALSDLAERTTEVRSLREPPTLKFSQSTALVRHNGTYWETDSSGEITGDPYCSRCWEVDGRRIHLDTWEGMLTCPQCSSVIS